MLNSREKYSLAEESSGKRSQRRIKAGEDGSRLSELLSAPSVSPAERIVPLIKPLAPQRPHGALAQARALAPKESHSDVFEMGLVPDPSYCPQALDSLRKRTSPHGKIIAQLSLLGDVVRSWEGGWTLRKSS